MADGLNRATLLGNLGADAELRFTQSGTGVLNMRIATTESYLKDGERTERTDWHNVVVWGKRAEALSKLLSKGSRVMVEGGLRTSSYDKDGVKVWKTEIHANEVFLLDGKSSGGRDRDEEDRGGRSDRGRGREDDRPREPARGRDDRERGRGRDDRGDRREASDDRRREPERRDNQSGGGNSSGSRNDDDIPF
jgi:single-strand DNA-binding protein